MPDSLSCFKAYDVRGRVPDELNADIDPSTGTLRTRSSILINIGASFVTLIYSVRTRGNESRFG